MRKIVHIDMDCFFAAVELRDNPKLRGKPVAVGGSPAKRGVISAASYEARNFGVHSALSTAEAIRRCPNLILLSTNFQKYKEASKQIFEIFDQYSDIIEPLSLDEAFIDLTHPKIAIKTATLAAKAIREKVHKKTGLTASAGIAPNPFLAKVASDWNKPNGQFTITPEMVASFVFELPLRKVPGVGKVTEEKLREMGFLTCGDLQVLQENEMQKRFGKWGVRLFSLCRGIDERQLGIKRERKSVSIERTFSNDLRTLDDCLKALPLLIDKFNERLSKMNNIDIKNVFVKLKFADFQSTTVDEVGMCNIDFASYKILLTRAYYRRDKAVRLIGIGARLKESHDGPEQLEFKGMSYEPRC